MADFRGLDTVLQNLNQQIEKIENRSLGGLIEAAALVRRDMRKTPPKIPVDTGNLRGSWFADPIKFKGKGPAVLCGFTANYAPYVHEMPEDTNFKRPDSGPKFFELALDRNKKEILKTIRDNAKVRS